MTDIIEVEVLGWEKYQHHNGDKTYHWFKLYNSIIDDPKIVSLTARQLKLWIYLLCMASKQRSSVCTLSTRHVHMWCNTRTHVVHKLIFSLEQFQLVRVISGTLEKSRVEESRKILLIKSKKSKPEASDSVFDFDKIYGEYPRKIGRKSGYKAFLKQIKTQENYNNLAKACNNYAMHCRKNDIELRFIKHFSTFMNHWEDWVNPDKAVVLGYEPIDIGKILGNDTRRI